MISFVLRCFLMWLTCHPSGIFTLGTDLVFSGGNVLPYFVALSTMWFTLLIYTVTCCYPMESTDPSWSQGCLAHYHPPILETLHISSAGIVFIRQNLTSTDVRFWRIKTIHAQQWYHQSQLVSVWLCVFLTTLHIPRVLESILTMTLYSTTMWFDPHMQTLNKYIYRLYFRCNQPNTMSL